MSDNLFPQFTGHPYWYVQNGSITDIGGSGVTATVQQDGSIVLNGTSNNNGGSLVILRYQSGNQMISDLKLAPGTYELLIDPGVYVDEMDGFTIWEQRLSGSAWSLRFTPYGSDLSAGTFEVGGNEHDASDSSGYVYFEFILKPDHSYDNFRFKPYLQETIRNSVETVEELYTGQGTYTFPPNTFEAARIYWQVRNYDSNGRVGDWSDTASFYSHGISQIMNLTCDGKPFATISWQVNGQISYEIKIDDKIHYGPEHGDLNQFTLPEPLSDGEHVIELQVQNSLGLLSEWESISVIVHNTPSSEVDLPLTVLGELDANLGWQAYAASPEDEFYVYRDEKLIARLNASAIGYVDRTVLGRHSYTVLQKLASGDYNRYFHPEVYLHSEVTRIAKLDGGPWIPLTLTKERYPTNTFNQSKLVEKTKIMGAKNPVVEVSEFEELSGKYEVSWPFAEREKAKPFEALIGEAVIVKSRGERVVIGVLEAYQMPINSKTVDYTFTIEQMATEEDFSLASENTYQLVPLKITENGVYSPGDYGGYGFGAIEAEVIGRWGTDLDKIRFGGMSPEELAAAATNPGYTDPQWYEAIAKAINDMLTGVNLREYDIWKDKVITENGDYIAFDDDAYGYTTVKVQVPQTGDGSLERETAILERSISGTYENSSLTRMGSFAFFGCSSLTGITISACTVIQEQAFAYCTALESITCSLCQSIGQEAFRNCVQLQTIVLPVCSEIQDGAFSDCQGLTNISFPLCETIGRNGFVNCGFSTVELSVCRNIGESAFYGCSRLFSLYLPGDSVCNLASVDAFLMTPFVISSYYSGRYGSIYVPASLYQTYITASNWSYYSRRFAREGQITAVVNGNVLEINGDGAMLSGTAIELNGNNVGIEQTALRID